MSENGEEAAQINEYVDLAYDFHVVNCQQQHSAIRLQVHTFNCHGGAQCGLGKRHVVSLQA
jgi:hypothetical protein